MAGPLRRKEILNYLANSLEPVSATKLAKHFSVSRQVIVQDVALLRAVDYDILSTNRGYLLQRHLACKRIFKVFHSDINTEDELQTIVDCGGRVINVFVNHKVYGIISAPLAIHSRLDIEKMMNNITAGKSTLLKNTTSGYHFHTVEAPSEEILDIIENNLDEKGYLAPVFDYEEPLLHEKL